MPHKLVDIGANLTHESFRHDLSEVLEGARAAGIERLVVTGTDIDSSEAAADLAEKHKGFLFSTAGFHPHVANEYTENNFSIIKELLDKPHVIAIGETGLDFNRNYSPAEAQLHSFRQHLELACEIKKPLFLHQRDAHKEFLPLLQEYRSNLGQVVVHCFTDSKQALFDYLDQDAYIGITGWVCDERRGQELQQLVKDIPTDRLLIETDAPYLLPRNLRPKPKSRRNEPKHLLQVLDTIAICVGKSVEQLASETRKNTRDCFGI